MFYAHMDSSLGEILLCSDGTALTGLYFVDQKDAPAPAACRPNGVSRSDPSAGMRAGRRLSGLRLRRREADLFSVPMDTVHCLGTPQNRSGEASPGDALPAAHAVFKQTYDELSEYLAGKRRVFTVPLSLRGTPFQQRIWEALLTIPFGKTVAYGEVAQAAGLSSGHGRPVGSAVGRNPISIIVPCHRVLSSAGTLNGYTGGLDRKLTLLEIEGYELC